MKRAAAGFGAWMVAALVIACISASSALAAEPTSSTGSPDATTPANPPQNFVDTALSHARGESRWAFVVRRVIARSMPQNDSRRVKRLTTRTPDRTHELVLTLTERKFDDGSRWVKVRLPMRPNNTTGWVPRSALGAYRVNRTSMVINRKKFRATLFKNGKAIWFARIGVGKAGTITPRGFFYVRSRLIPSNPSGIYGPFAFGLSAYSKTLTDWPGGGMIGIHGTNRPRLLPGRVSHGCIRVPNKKIRRLSKLMPAGTPVQIR